MLELRPNCEHCQTALPADSMQARVCSFECTFCASCVEGVLKSVCPNCGGGFVPRPIRPSMDWKGSTSLGAHPASIRPRHRPVDAVTHAELVARVGDLPPQ